MTLNVLGQDEMLTTPFVQYKNLGKCVQLVLLGTGFRLDPSTFWCPATALGFGGGDTNADSKGSVIQPPSAFGETHTSRILQSRVCVAALWLLQQMTTSWVV